MTHPRGWMLDELTIQDAELLLLLKAQQLSSLHIVLYMHRSTRDVYVELRANLELGALAFIAFEK